MQFPASAPEGEVCAVPLLSVVVPIYNERDNVAPLHEALSYALQ